MRCEGDTAALTMLAIFDITTPFFALVVLGYLAARMKWMPESVVPGLNTFVLYFALPCMLFRFGAATPMAQLLNPALLGVWLAAALLIVGFTIWATRSARIDLKNAALGALVAAFPNTGFMGVPLLTNLLGPAAVGPLVCALLVDLFVTSSLCIALAQAHDARGQGLRAAFAKALRGAAGNPLPWAIALGALFGAMGWALPGPVDAVTRMLGDAATPVALFTIGAVLCISGQHAHTRTPVADYLPIAAVKLFVHPLLVFGLCISAQSAGLLTASQTAALTLAAALPSASNVSLLAERYGADNGRIARIIMSSTALAFLSFSALAAWLR
jgi:malonate transporter and related proteins